MSTVGGYSAGSGNSVGSGKNFSTLLAGVVISSSGFSAAYNVSAGSGFSSGSGNSQYAAMKSSFAAKDQTAGVTTLKGAMAVEY